MQWESALLRLVLRVLAFCALLRGPLKWFSRIIVWNCACIRIQMSDGPLLHVRRVLGHLAEQLKERIARQSEAGGWLQAAAVAPLAAPQQWRRQRVAVQGL